MLGKNNYQEKTRQERDKRERFSIRKLAMGAASVLLGFSFLMGNKETVKADIAPQESASTAAKGAIDDSSDITTPLSTDDVQAKTPSPAVDETKANPKLSTFSGLRSFLRAKPATSSSETKDARTDAPSSADIAAEQEEANSKNSQVVTNRDSAALSAAVQNLQDKISQGQATVASTVFAKAEKANQDALTEAISAGQDVLDKYKSQQESTKIATGISLRDENEAVTLEQLNSASDQIVQALTPFTSQIGPQIQGTYYGSNGDCKVYLDKDNEVLTITPGDGGNTLASGNILSGVQAANMQWYVKKIVIDDKVKLPRDASGMFSGFRYLTEIDGLDNVDTSDVTNMQEMFAGDERLASLDLSKWDTSKVTNMSKMFGDSNGYYDEGLTSLKLNGKFNTKNVTNMKGMFEGDKRLASLDLSEWDTSKVTDMSAMFSGDAELNSLNLENWNTSEVTNMSNMFAHTEKLTKLDLHGFNTDNVTDMNRMFTSSGVENIDLSNFNTTNVTDMSYMFMSSAAKNITFGTNFNTSNVTNMAYMFNGTEKLEKLDLSNFVIVSDCWIADMLYDTGLPTDDNNAAGGNPKRFVLTLGKRTNLKHESQYDKSGVANDSYGYHDINRQMGYVRAVGNGDEDKPNGAIMSAQDLEDIYSNDDGNLPVETYIITDEPDNERHTVNQVNSNVCNILDFQTKEQVLEAAKSLMVDETHPYGDASDKTKMPDVAAPGRALVDSIEWLSPSEAEDSGKLDDGYSNLFGNNGTIISDNIQDGQAEAVARVTYGDGTKSDVLIRLKIVNGPEAKMGIDPVDSGKQASDDPQDYVNAEGLDNYGLEYSYASDRPTLTWHQGGEHDRDGNYLQDVQIKVTYPGTGDTKTLTAKVPVKANKITVHHYLEDANGNPTTTRVPGMNDRRVNGNIGGSLTVTPDFNAGDKPSVGYSHASGSHDKLTLNDIEENDSRTINIYYTANPVTVNVKHKLQGNSNSNLAEISDGTNVIGDSLNSDDTAHVGDTVTVTANDVPKGYILLSDKTQTHEITPDEGQSSHAEDNNLTITFNYALVSPVSKTLTVYQGSTLPDAKQVITNYGDLAGITSTTTDPSWQDATDEHPNPTVDQLGTTTYNVKIHTTDSNLARVYGVNAPNDGAGYIISVPVTVKVVAKPGLTMADTYHPIGGTVNVPQYTDLPQDSALAQAGISNSTELPEGTVYGWDLHKGQVPDTTLNNSHQRGFVNVRFPDDSYASIPVKVNVNDKVVKEVKIKHNAYIYNDQGKRANGLTLKAGSVVTTYGTKVIDGRQFYLLKDSGYYLAVGNDIPVVRKLDHAAYTYDGRGKRVEKNHVMYAGGKVKTYGVPVIINGEEYYVVGHDRYMKKSNFPPTPEWNVPGISPDDLATDHNKKRLTHNAYFYDEAGIRTGRVTLKAGSVIETTGTKEIAGKNYYALSNGTYIKQSNAE